MSRENFISRVMLLAHFPKRTPAESWARSLLWVLGCHIQHEAALLLHPCSGIFAKLHFWASQSISFILGTRGTLWGERVPVLEIPTREQDKSDTSKAHLTPISNGAKSQELQSTELRSGEGRTPRPPLPPRYRASTPLQRWLQDMDPSTARHNSQLERQMHCLASHIPQGHTITAFGHCLLFTHWSRNK